jgi:hypothetical protein
MFEFSCEQHIHPETPFDQNFSGELCPSLYFLLERRKIGQNSLVSEQFKQSNNQSPRVKRGLKGVEMSLGLKGMWKACFGVGVIR